MSVWLIKILLYVNTYIHCIEDLVYGCWFLVVILLFYNTLDSKDYVDLNQMW